MLLRVQLFKAVVVDMERPPRMDLDTHWLACHVMLSRAASIEGLLILRATMRKELSRRFPAYLVAVIDRLLALEKSSTVELLRYLHSFSRRVILVEIIALVDAQAELREAEAFRSARQHVSLSKAPDAKRRRLTFKQLAPSYGLPDGSQQASSSHKQKLRRS